LHAQLSTPGTFWQRLARKRVNGFEPSTFTIGNVRVGDTQTAESKTVPADEVDARSKYAARNTVQIKRISVYSVCEWPRDPDYVQAV
jgi:hypothetical protein